MDIDSNEGEEDGGEGRRFLGYARVALSALHFNQQSDLGHRNVSDRNVSRILRIFKIEGCQRKDENHFLTGIVDGAEDLREALTSAPSAYEQLPVLPHCRVECLNGLHRILAAREHLDQNDQWWIVRLYTSAFPRQEQTVLAEEYRNEQAFSDGEIFHKIRTYHHEGSKAAEGRWWARLSQTKRKDLRQLLKDTRFADAFDALLPWPGLWATIRLGSLHRLLTLKCDEELLQYLRHIYKAWTSILQPVSDQNYEPRHLVNRGTVEQLQGLSPTMSTADRDMVNELMAQADIFEAISLAEHRSLVLEGLLTYPSMIPSLFTFFENLKYLEPCARILRCLLPARHKKSIFEAFSAAYFPPDHVTVEHAACVVKIHSKTTTTQDLLYAYQQLWLFALRDCASMTPFTPRKEPHKPKPSPQESDGLLWQRFGELAWRVGFHLTEADNLRSEDAQLQRAGRILSSDNSRVYDEETVQRLASLLRTDSVAEQISQEAMFTTNVDLSSERRCGRPFEDDYLNDRALLFLPQLYASASPVALGLTTFYCKWSMLRAFFDINVVFEMLFRSLASAYVFQVGLSDVVDVQVGIEARPVAGPQSSCATCTTLLATLQASRDRCSHLEHEVTENISLVAQLQQSSERTGGDAARYENTVNQLNNSMREAADLNESNTRLRRSAEELSENLDQARRETIEARTRIIQLESLEHDLVNGQDDLDRLRRRAEELSRTLDQARTRITQLENESIELSAVLVRHRQEVQVLTTRALSAEEQVASSQAAVLNREREFVDEARALRESKEAAEILSKALQTSRERFEARNITLEEANGELRTANTAVRSEAERMRATLREKSEILSDMEQKHQVVERRNEDLQSQLEESQRLQYSLNAQTATSFTFDSADDADAVTDSETQSLKPTLTTRNQAALNQDLLERLENSPDFVDAMFESLAYDPREYTLVITEKTEQSYLIFRVVDFDNIGKTIVMDWVLPKSQAKHRSGLLNERGASTDFFLGEDHKRLVGTNLEQSADSSYVFECWCAKHILWALRKGSAARLGLQGKDWPDLTSLQTFGVDIRENRVSLERKRPDLIPGSAVGKRKRERWGEHEVGPRGSLKMKRQFLPARRRAIEDNSEAGPSRRKSDEDGSAYEDSSAGEDSSADEESL
ncbi:hypothetical protein LTR78_007435 [Recurvomyces mirabilis]|uniref:Uncharacterized protein n=1 Tax=Recurvomyces mirabilis TaxID=574656 RepID=A0AAE0TUD3_9PEZI|nr:hypothetical protein LTR78_007435 [Recurvomyces mirabilis]KAK5160056.1 hypothetical protein LTS14_002162 [Recurvomyces mirabilis]